jgi:hypothetical protein
VFPEIPEPLRPIALISLVDYTVIVLNHVFRQSR